MDGSSESLFEINSGRNQSKSYAAVRKSSKLPSQPPMYRSSSQDAATSVQHPSASSSSSAPYMAASPASAALSAGAQWGGVGVGSPFSSGLSLDDDLLTTWSDGELGDVHQLMDLSSDFYVRLEELPVSMDGVSSLAPGPPQYGPQTGAAASSGLSGRRPPPSIDRSSSTAAVLQAASLQSSYAPFVNTTSDFARRSSFYYAGEAFGGKLQQAQHFGNSNSYQQQMLHSGPPPVSIYSTMRSASGMLNNNDYVESVLMSENYGGPMDTGAGVGAAPKPKRSYVRGGAKNAAAAATVARADGEAHGGGDHGNAATKPKRSYTKGGKNNAAKGGPPADAPTGNSNNAMNFGGEGGGASFFERHMQRASSSSAPASSAPVSSSSAALNHGNGSADDSDADSDDEDNGGGGGGRGGSSATGGSIAYERKKQKAKDGRVKLNDAIDNLAAAIESAKNRSAERLKVSWCGGGGKAARAMPAYPAAAVSSSSSSTSSSNLDSFASSLQGLITKCTSVHKFDRPHFIGLAADVTNDLNQQAELLFGEIERMLARLSLSGPPSGSTAPAGQQQQRDMLLDGGAAKAGAVGTPTPMQKSLIQTLSLTSLAKKGDRPNFIGLSGDIINELNTQVELLVNEVSRLRDKIMDAERRGWGAGAAQAGLPGSPNGGGGIASGEESMEDDEGGGGSPSNGEQAKKNVLGQKKRKLLNSRGGSVDMFDDESNIPAPPSSPSFMSEGSAWQAGGAGAGVSRLFALVLSQRSGNNASAVSPLYKPGRNLLGYLSPRCLLTLARTCTSFSDTLRRSPGVNLLWRELFVRRFGLSSGSSSSSLSSISSDSWMSKYKSNRALSLPPSSDVSGSVLLGSVVGPLASAWVTLVPRSNGLTNRAVACGEGEAGGKAAAGGRRFKAMQVVQLRVVITNEAGGRGGWIVVPQQSIAIEDETRGRTGVGAVAAAAKQQHPRQQSSLAPFLEIVGDPRLSKSAIDLKGRSVPDLLVAQWRSGGGVAVAAVDSAIVCLGALDSCIVQVFLNCEGCDTEKIFIDNLVQRRMRMTLKAFVVRDGVGEEIALEVPFLNETL